MTATPSTTAASKQVPWNKGKIVGAKPPLRPKHVWSILTKLQVEGRTRDLAMFNVAIDSKLRGCDVVALKVDDVAPGGYSADRATVRQKKTGRPVKFELTESTRQAIDEYLRLTGQEARRISVHRPTPEWTYDGPPVCSPPIPLARRHRTGPAPVRDAFPSPDQGDLDLSPNRQPASCAATSGTY